MKTNEFLSVPKNKRKLKPSVNSFIFLVSKSTLQSEVCIADVSYKNGIEIINFETGYLFFNENPFDCESRALPDPPPPEREV